MVLYYYVDTRAVKYFYCILFSKILPYLSTIPDSAKSIEIVHWDCEQESPAFGAIFMSSPVHVFGFLEQCLIYSWNVLHWFQQLSRNYIQCGCSAYHLFDKPRWLVVITAPFTLTSSTTSEGQRAHRSTVTSRFPFLARPFLKMHNCFFSTTALKSWNLWLPSPHAVLQVEDHQ